MRHLLLLLPFLLLAACNTQEIGKGCDETVDCRDIPNGYCALAGVCTATCDTPGAACAPDGVCVDIAFRTICLEPCVEDGDCGAGETCEVVRPAPSGDLPAGACAITNPLVEP